MELDEDTPELNAPWSSYYKGGKNGQKNSLGTFWKDLNNYYKNGRMNLI